MAQHGTRSRFGFEGQGRPTPAQLTALALRSIGQVYDMNLSAARVLLQTQARAASAIGLPDWSGLFNTVDERARHVFSAGAEQLVNTTQRANEVAAELQREVGRVVETQTTTVAETLKQGLEELGAQANEGLTQLVQTVRQQAEEAERAASSVNEQMRDTMQQGGEQARDTLQRGQQAIGQAYGGDGGQPAAQGDGPQPAEEMRTGEDRDKRRSKQAA
jgi:hypothetical protein